MSNSGRAVFFFATGLGLGAGLALLFAPKSGEETREWLKGTAEKGVKQLRRQGHQSIDRLHEVVDSGEKKVASAFETSRNVLDSVAAKLG